MSVPHSLEAEQALLGALLIDNGAFDRIAGLRPEQFFEPMHQRIIEVMRDLVGKGRSADVLSVAERLQSDPRFAELGGARYLADLDERAPPAAIAGDYAAIIAGHATRRAMIDTASVIVAAARGDMDREASDIALEAEKQFTQIARDGMGKGKMRSIGVIASASLDRARRGPASSNSPLAYARSTPRSAASTRAR